MLPLVQHIMSDVVASQRSLSQLTPQEEQLHRQRRALDWSGRSRLYAMREEIARADQTMQDATAELEKLVNSSAYTCAFSMYPTSIEDLMEIADAGGIMPPKSTWFEPKLRDAMFCHMI